MNNLPATGRHLVDTVTDTYDVDVDARIAVRLDLATEAEGGVGQPEVFLFDTVECSKGEAMIFDADTYPHVTAAVLGITPAGVTA